MKKKAQTSHLQLNASIALIIGCIFALFIGGSYCFLLDVTNDKFHTTPALLIGIILGIAGVLVTAVREKEITFPPFSLLIVILAWFIYQIYCTRFNIIPLNQLLIDSLSFSLAYYFFAIRPTGRLFYSLLALLGISISVVGAIQYIGLLPSFNPTFQVTGVFDNPAGISAALSSILPFLFYFTCKKSGLAWWGYLMICLFLCLIIFLSRARAGIFAIAIAFSYFLLDKLLQKEHRKCCWKYIFLLLFGAILLLAFLYLINTSSANGRLLIWRCCFDMIMENPLFGVGDGGFKAFYMPAQAVHFMKHPMDSWGILSSNIYHPFNEYLKIWVEQGTMGIILTMGVIVSIVRYYWKHKTDEKLFAFLSLIALATYAFFSYPFDYPVIRLLLLFILAQLMTAPTPSNACLKNKKCNILFRVLLTLFSVCSIVSIAYQGYYQFKWKQLIDKDVSIIDHSTNSEFQQLYKSLYLQNDPGFIYNYTTVLSESKLNRECIDIVQKGINKINDYDTQLLQAYSHREMGNLVMAEKHFRMASYMIPNRLLPQYELFRIQKADKRMEDEAKATALKIATMPIKVESDKAKFIKSEIEYYLLNH